MVWIRIRTNILLVLILVKIVCKGYQQTTKVANSNGRVYNLKAPICPNQSEHMISCFEAEILWLQHLVDVIFLGLAEVGLIKIHTNTYLTMIIPVRRPRKFWKLKNHTIILNFCISYTRSDRYKISLQTDTNFIKTLSSDIVTLKAKQHQPMHPAQLNLKFLWSRKFWK